MIRRNTCSSEAPSMRAASMISSGTALIAADRTTMAKPVCIQTMITISNTLFHGCWSSQATGCWPSPIMIPFGLLNGIMIGLAQHPVALLAKPPWNNVLLMVIMVWMQTDVRPEALRTEAVDEVPDDRRAGEGDGHRQKDQGLRHGLPAAEPVGERGETQADGRGHQRNQDDPSRRVADRGEHALVGEHELEVVEAHELARGRVLEADDDRVDDRIDEEDAQDDEARTHEDVWPDPLPKPGGEVAHEPVHGPEQEEDPSHPHPHRYQDDQRPGRL